MAVGLFCKTRQALCIQGALVAQRRLSQGTHRGAVARNSKRPRDYGALHAMVDRQGLEPWTLGLRVPCSTN